MCSLAFAYTGEDIAYLCEKLHNLLFEPLVATYLNMYACTVHLKTLPTGHCILHAAPAIHPTTVCAKGWTHSV